MALEGSIKEFGLADIFQLLYHQKKTGVLIVEGPFDTVKIFFSKGNIVATKSSKRPEDEKMGRILVNKGLLREADLDDLLQEQRLSNTRLGILLVKRGLVSKEVLADIITHHIVDQLVQMFSWKEGTYEFIPQEVSAYKELDISIDTQHILFDGLRILDEWSVIQGVLSPDTIFIRTDETINTEDLRLKEKEMHILSLIDGERDVCAVADLSGFDDFTVLKTLVAFLEKNLISPVEGIKETVEVVPERKEFPLQSLYNYAFAAVIVAALLISLLPMFFKGFSLYKNLSAVRDIERLRQAVESGRLERGVFPESLPVTGLKDPWGNGYIYRTNNSNYVLLSAGPDGLPDTADDIY